jgi:hypothetical protein
VCVECGEELAGALSNCTVQLVHSSFAIRNDAGGRAYSPTQENTAACNDKQCGRNQMQPTGPLLFSVSFFILVHKSVQ